MRQRTKRQLTAAVSVVIAFITCTNVVLIANSNSQDLTITTNFEGKQSIAPRDEIELKLSRSLAASEGRITVVIGRTDISSLLTVTDSTLVYAPTVLPLPAGENQVFVYLVSSDNSWKQIAQFTLRVQGSPAPQTASQIPDTTQASSNSPQSTTTANGAGRKWGFDKAGITPSFTIGMKSQAAERHFPDSNRPPRPTFADMTLQGSLRSDLSRGLFSSQTQFDVVGSSFEQEALRFGQLGRTAPQVDLSSYLMQFQLGKAKLNVGHIAFGSNRHLINSFSSRGLLLTVPITARSDFSLAAMNGTSIVGWSNFAGISRREHQIVTGTLGFELLPKRPGGLRFETSLLDGRLLPLSNFNQGAITDAERSHGLGLRILATDSSQRWRLDGGITRSRFTNPADPLLYQGRNVIPVREVTRNARYIDGSYAVLQNLALTDTKKASLTLNYRHERVDPLFRSIAASIQSDRMQNQFEAVALIGELTAAFSHLRFNDNLGNIASILKSLARRTNLIMSVPISSLVGNTAKPSRWLPRISYSFDELHQFGASIPVNGGFEVNPNTVPDQLSMNQILGAEWQWQRARFGYRFNRSFQDNRQTGRKEADLRNLINGFTFGINPSAALDLSFDVNAESALNKEMRRADNTLRLGSNINWRMTQRMALAATVSGAGAGATAGVIKNRSAELDLQWSYRWALEKSRFRKVQGQFFIRYANRYARNRDNLFGFNNLLKLQTFNMGVSFTFF